MRKDYRQNYRMGTNPFARKSNLQKIAETFGPKKKVKKNKKPTKRMFANVGGGADTGKMGEVKSKLATAMDKLKKLKAMGKKVKKDEVKIDNFGLREEKAKGGSAKKKKKFPDMSGDGKVTMKVV
jgi:hypothetical protein